MCKNKKLQKRMVDLFEEKVAKVPAIFAFDDLDEREKAQYPIPIAERDVFKKVVQSEFPDLRYRNINGLITIDDFAQKVEEELQRKKDFFNKALELIQKVTGHSEYTFGSILYEEHLPTHKEGNARLSDEANYFIICQKVFRALSSQMYTKIIFHPTAPALENAKNLHELIDIYYRKGKF